MAVQSLAVKYRPSSFDDVVEQGAIKTILRNQLNTGETKNAYLFCGGAGTGKTTCARIFAKEINKGVGTIIELDAASNNSVDDVREIGRQAKTKSLDGEYKTFVVDECHSLSSQAWQAFLKLLEEPPAKTIFIFCTTDPQKIPKTILSRVQRYDFQRISNSGIVDRLSYICKCENVPVVTDALDYISKVADGGMRDAITLLDKCLSLTTNLSVATVVETLGTADYDDLYNLTHSILLGDDKEVFSIVEEIHYSGKDLKQFIRQFVEYCLDVIKYDCTHDLLFTTLPNTELKHIQELCGIKNGSKSLPHLLDTLVELSGEIKWDVNPKYMIEAKLYGECKI